MTSPDSFPHVPGVEHRFVEANGVRLHVAEAGDPDADPIVLLHGWPQHWFMWRRVIPQLATVHRVICPDHRGFGWSDAPSSSYSKDELTDDLLALLDVLGLDRVRLAGHDWGGHVGFLACLRQPDRFEDLLALAAPHPWMGLGARPSLRTLPAMLYQPLLAAPGIGPAAQRFTPLYEAFFAITGGERIWSAEERDAFIRVLREPARAAASTQLYRTFLLRELPALARGRWAGERLSVPARLVVGSRDPVVRLETVGGWEGHADDMHVEEVESGHFVPEERPEIVLDRLLAAIPA